MPALTGQPSSDSSNQHCQSLAELTTFKVSLVYGTLGRS
jgi:hypothetical protein